MAPHSPFVNDCDLLAVIHSMLKFRREGRLKSSKLRDMRIKQRLKLVMFDMTGTKVVSLSPDSLRVVINHASLPGPLAFLDSSWCGLSLTLSLRRMWLSGLTVLSSNSSLLPSWPHSLGLRVPLTWENMVFPFLSCQLCLSKMRGIG